MAATNILLSVVCVVGFKACTYALESRARRDEKYTPVRPAKTIRSEPSLPICIWNFLGNSRVHAWGASGEPMPRRINICAQRFDVPHTTIKAAFLAGYGLPRKRSRGAPATMQVGSHRRWQTGPASGPALCAIQDATLPATLALVELYLADPQALTLWSACQVDLVQAPFLRQQYPFISSRSSQRLSWTALAFHAPYGFLLTRLLRRGDCRPALWFPLRG
ncbi:hypothetical protein C8Q73DRAFT_148295 [Cubamyces lactineus]|nr:hypothetical protein C8Q73DRAFT_148295 [Cubamyces lactineus]